MLLDAIITAGGDPGKDADLLAHAGDAPCKALIRLGDKTFLEHVVSAIWGTGRVRRVVVVGLAPKHQLDLGSQVAFIPDAGGMIENGEAGVQYLRSTGKVSERLLTSSSDIPLITSRIICDLIDLCLPHDVDFCYTVVPKETMERAFPGSGRTFVPMADGRFAGGDIFVAKPSMLDSDKQLWRELVGRRKTAWQQVRAIGLGTLFLFAIRRLTIAQAERRVGKALGLTARAIISPHAEVAMDVDKPHHLDTVQAAWNRRQQGMRAG